MKTKHAPTDRTDKVRIPDDNRLTAAEAILAASNADRPRERAAIEAAQTDLAPYVRQANDALAELGRVLKFRDNEKLLRLATQIDWDQFRARRGLDEADRTRAQRFVRDTNALVNEVRDRLHKIPARVAALSFEDLAPHVFEGEPWNGMKLGLYPLEPSRIKRHVLQLVKTASGMSRRFDELGHLLGQLQARVAKASPDAENDRVAAIPPETLEARRAGRPAGNQTTADYDEHR